MTAQLTAHGLCLTSPTGRSLVSDLTLSVADTERVAIVGRNGTGKTTLLRALAGTGQPSSGHVRCSGSRLMVAQLPDGDADIGQRTATGSPGELRRLLLQQAFEATPSFLLLDEPSVDLDDCAINWLCGALRRHSGACLLVSHDRRLLRHFRDFFVVTESGGYHHAGDFDSLLESMAAKQEFSERKYVHELARHVSEEQNYVRIARRQERKQNVGRVRQLSRCKSRMLLNTKRGQAQLSRARSSALQQARIGVARDWVKSVRRALDVDLPLEMAWPAGSAFADSPIIEALHVPLRPQNAADATKVELRIRHERWAITGPNGSGKSTLLRTLLGEQGAPGITRVDLARVGYVAQNAENWRLPHSLLEMLCADATDLPRAATTVAAHRFPIALAQRPLSSLSPGERVRAALIALAARQPRVELLVLDEPTNHLDLLATAQLENVLRAWPGGLLVVSHDREFLASIGVQNLLEL